MIVSAGSEMRYPRPFTSWQIFSNEAVITSQVIAAQAAFGHPGHIYGTRCIYRQSMYFFSVLLTNQFDPHLLTRAGVLGQITIDPLRADASHGT